MMSGQSPLSIALHSGNAMLSVTAFFTALGFILSPPSVAPVSTPADFNMSTKDLYLAIGVAQATATAAAASAAAASAAAAAASTAAAAASTAAAAASTTATAANTTATTASTGVAQVKTALLGSSPAAIIIPSGVGSGWQSRTRWQLTYSVQNDSLLGIKVLYYDIQNLDSLTLVTGDGNPGTPQIWFPAGARPKYFPGHYDLGSTPSGTPNGYQFYYTIAPSGSVAWGLMDAISAAGPVAQPTTLPVAFNGIVIPANFIECNGNFQVA